MKPWWMWSMWSRVSRSFFCKVCSKVSDSHACYSLVPRLFFVHKNSLGTRLWLPSLVALMLAMRILFCSTLCKVCLQSFWCSFTGLVQLTVGFSSWFHSIWFYYSHMFHSFLSQITLCFSFGLKDMITAFTRLLSYRYSSFTMRAYLCWRHTYCQSNSQRTSLPRTKWPLTTPSKVQRFINNAQHGARLLTYIKDIH